MAVAVGLRAATGVRGIEDTSARALAKLEAVLPHRLRLRVNECGTPSRPALKTPPPTRQTQPSTQDS